MVSTKKQLLHGVFYTAISKYAGIVVSLVVAGILARLLTPADFGIVAVATVIIAFFSVFSDLGIAPAIVQNQTLTLRTICQLLSINLFFATVNVVPNALLYKAQRFRFIAFRSLGVQDVCGGAAIGSVYMGAGIYALLINPICSAVVLFCINFAQYPQHVRLRMNIGSIRKIFSYSMYQFFFNLINYFTRNLDKLLVGKYMGLSPLGYYEKSYRLMMLPLQNITHVVSPVLHPVFSEFQNDMRRLSDSYVKVVRFLAFVGFPLFAVLFFVSRFTADLSLVGSLAIKSAILALILGLYIQFTGEFNIFVKIRSLLK